MRAGWLMQWLARIFSALPAPCTGAGYSTTGTTGSRRFSVVSTSRSAAACGEVITPIRPGNAGKERLRSVANSPSFASNCFSRSNCSYSTPSPAGRICSTVNWNSPRCSYKVAVANTSTCCPLPTGLLNNGFCAGTSHSAPAPCHPSVKNTNGRKQPSPDWIFRRLPIAAGYCFPATA